jgi:hypothetical protein
MAVFGATICTATPVQAQNGPSYQDIEKCSQYMTSVDRFVVEESVRVDVFRNGFNCHGNSRSGWKSGEDSTFTGGGQAYSFRLQHRLRARRDDTVIYRLKFGYVRGRSGGEQTCKFQIARQYDFGGYEFLPRGRAAIAANSDWRTVLRRERARYKDSKRLKWDWKRTADWLALAAANKVLPEGCTPMRRPS